MDDKESILRGLHLSLSVWEQQVQDREAIVTKLQDDLGTAKQYLAIATANVAGIRESIERIRG